MKRPLYALLAVLAAVALPARADWELVRGNDNQRLSIDPKSVKSRGAETSFKYLIDFREDQGEVGGRYRSIVVGATLRCTDRQMAMTSFELYSGSTGQGVQLAQPEPSAAEKRFQPVANGSSDEDLYQRLCEKPGAKPKK